MFLEFNVNIFVKTCFLDLFFKISQYLKLALFFKQSSDPIHVISPLSDKLRQYIFIVFKPAIYPKQKFPDKNQLQNNQERLTLDFSFEHVDSMREVD